MRKYIIVVFVLAATTLPAQTRQQWRDSLEVLNAKIGRDPNNLDLHLLKAEANINLEQWDYALAEYGKILHVDEKNLAALYFRAFVHIQQHHLDLARVDYETFLRLQPQHFEARLGLAHVLQKMGRKSDTTDELNRRLPGLLSYVDLSPEEQEEVIMNARVALIYACKCKEEGK